MDNAVKQRRSGAVLSYIYIIVNSLIILVYQPLVLRLLGQSEYGLYQLMTSVINYLNVMDLGFGSGIVVYTAKYHAAGDFEKEKKLHGIFLLIFSGIGILTFAIGSLIAANAGRIFLALTPAEIEKSKILLMILSVNIALTFVLSIYGNIIIAYEKFVFSKLLNIIRVTLNPLIMIPLLTMGADSVVMVAVISCINVACLLSNIVFCKKKLGVSVKFNGFDKSLFFQIFSFSIFIFIAEVVDKVNWSVDQAILGVVRGTAEVTVYSMASNYNQMAIQLSCALSSVMPPKIAKMVEVGHDDKSLFREFLKVSRLQFYIVFLFVSGFIMLGHKFVLWHVGPGCENSYYIAVLLIIGSAIPLTQSVGLSILKAKNMYKFRALIILAMACVNVGVSIPLAVKFGGIGCAMGTTMALIIANVIIMNIYYQKRCGLDIISYWKTILLMLVKFIPSVALTLILKFTLNLPGMSEFFVLGFFYVITFALTAYFFVMNEYEKDIVKRTLRKVTGRLR